MLEAFTLMSETKSVHFWVIELVISIRKHIMDLLPRKYTGSTERLRWILRKLS